MAKMFRRGRPHGMLAKKPFKGSKTERIVRLHKASPNMSCKLIAETIGCSAGLVSQVIRRWCR